MPSTKKWEQVLPAFHPYHRGPNEFPSSCLLGCLDASDSQQTSSTSVVVPAQGQVVHVPQALFTLHESLDLDSAQSNHRAGEGDLLELAVFVTRACWQGGVVLVCKNLLSTLVDIARDLHGALVWTLVVTAQVRTVGIEPESRV